MWHNVTVGRWGASVTDTSLKRAIALGGGGPAAGLELGVLSRLSKEMKFDVWALSCIGAWVGIVYNQCDPGSEVDQTRSFFRDHVFRDDASYERFPVNNVFAPDFAHYAAAFTGFVGNPETYPGLMPTWSDFMRSIGQTFDFMTNPRAWTVGDFNQWVLNSLMAVSPASRFLTSLMFLSGVTGLSRIYYPNSNILRAIDFGKLQKKKDTVIFHNAWNLTKQRLELFSNQTIAGRHYGDITAASLCACSALPFVLEPVVMHGDVYCEGALIDTVNFKNLLEDHFDLDEIWICRIVDASQVHAPADLDDALSNLCELFAATVGEDDIKLFYHHVKEEIEIKGECKKWTGTIVEIQVSPYVNFDWSHSNLENGESSGWKAADDALREYRLRTGGRKNTSGKVKFINRLEDAKPGACDDPDDPPDATALGG